MAFRPVARLFVRHPLQTLDKLILVGLLGCALLFGVFVIFIGLPDGLGLLIFTGILLISAGVIATGMRWVPVLGVLVSVLLLVLFLFVVPFPVYHLTHPREAFMPFVMVTLMLSFLVTLFITTGIAAAQDYRHRERRMPRWLPALLTGVYGVMIGMLLIAAIAQPQAATATAGGEPTVHMGPGSFLQTQVTIPKGSKVLFVDDGAFYHVLSNGTYNNGQAQPENLSGAPTLNNHQITGGSFELGPFVTAGTYHVYCTVHPGMSLTIIVQ